MTVQAGLRLCLLNRTGIIKTVLTKAFFHFLLPQKGLLSIRSLQTEKQGSVQAAHHYSNQSATGPSGFAFWQCPFINVESALSQWYGSTFTLLFAYYSTCS
jgi:hypothetical protein